MKILIKFDYENKTYYVYQEDSEIKYGTNVSTTNKVSFSFFLV